MPIGVVRRKLKRVRASSWGLGHAYPTRATVLQQSDTNVTLIISHIAIGRMRAGFLTSLSSEQRVGTDMARYDGFRACASPTNGDATMSTRATTSKRVVNYVEIHGQIFVSITEPTCETDFQGIVGMIQPCYEFHCRSAIHNSGAVPANRPRPREHVSQ